jgi:hypothetical protein
MKPDMLSVEARHPGGGTKLAINYPIPTAERLQDRALLCSLPESGPVVARVAIPVHDALLSFLHIEVASHQGQRLSVLAADAARDRNDID